MEFGAMVYDSTASERLALYARARNEHAASPTSSTAIRLAVLTAALEGSDRGFESALSLLGYAERQSAEGPDTDLAFIRFFRPIIRQLAEQQDRLDAEKQEKQVLQEQLDALKRLEEQLNADDALR